MAHELADENLQLQSLGEQTRGKPDHNQEQHSFELGLHNQKLGHHSFLQELHNQQLVLHSWKLELHNFQQELHNQYSLSTQVLPLFDHSGRLHLLLLANGMYVCMGLHIQILELHNFPQELHIQILGLHNFLQELHIQFHSHNHLHPFHHPLPCDHLMAPGRIFCKNMEHHRMLLEHHMKEQGHHRKEQGHHK